MLVKGAITMTKHFAISQARMWYNINKKEARKYILTAIKSEVK